MEKDPSHRVHREAPVICKYFNDTIFFYSANKPFQYMQYHNVRYLVSKVPPVTVTLLTKCKLYFVYQFMSRLNLFYLRLLERQNNIIENYSTLSTCKYETEFYILQTDALLYSFRHFKWRRITFLHPVLWGRVMQPPNLDYGENSRYTCMLYG